MWIGFWGKHMSEWQTMDNAPKDGTPMLMWLGKPIDRNYQVQDFCPNFAIGFWMYQRWQAIEVEDCGSMGGEYTGWMPDWCCLDIKPTHWMPLPEGPEAK
jgi:hypothetical protein